MRLAADLAADAMEHVRDTIRAGMKTSEVGALYEGYVHSHGTGYRGQVDHARAFTLGVVGPGDPHVHGHERPDRVRARADAARDLGRHRRLLVRSDQERLPGLADAEYDELTDGLLGRLPPGDRASAARGRACPSSTGWCGTGSPRWAIPGSRRIRSPTASAPAPTSRRTRTRPGRASCSQGMVLAVEPGLYWPGGGGLRVEDNFLITESGCEMLGRYPDDFRRA